MSKIRKERFVETEADKSIRTGTRPLTEEEQAQKDKELRRIEKELGIPLVDDGPKKV